MLSTCDLSLPSNFYKPSLVFNSFFQNSNFEIAAEIIFIVYEEE